MIVVFAIIAAAFAMPGVTENTRQERAAVYSTGAFPYGYSAGVPAVSAYSAYPGGSYSVYPYGDYYYGYPSVRYV